MKISSESSLSWVFLSDTDVSEARKIMRELGSDSTIDTLKIGGPLEVVSDLFFPGTSTLHTAFRYVFFVPAILFAMKKRGGVADARAFLKKKENELIFALEKGGEEEGVIGRLRHERLHYWPSMTYWTAFNKFRLFGELNGERTEILDTLTHIPGDRIVSDDGDIQETPEDDLDFDAEFEPIAESIFNSKTMKWPANGMTFALRRYEAKFIKDRIHRYFSESLYTDLFTLPIRQIANYESIFNVRSKDPKTNDVIKQSENYSLLAMGITLAYRWVLCKNRKWDDAQKIHLGHCQRWVNRNAVALRQWSVDDLRNAANNKSASTAWGSWYKELKSFTDDCRKILCGTESLGYKLNKLEPMLIGKEWKTKGNQSRFIDTTIRIPENIMSPTEDTIEKYLFDYRWPQGQRNTLAILRGLNT